MQAILYEARDWGLVEVKRVEVSDRNPYYKQVRYDPMMANMSTAKNAVPMMTQVTEENFIRIGEMPTGEQIFLKQ